MVGEGEPAPDFVLPSTTGDTIKLSEMKGRKIILYFYPRAMTPGCTREAEEFNKHLEEFERLGVQVLGVSTDSVERNRRFAEKYGLKFPLLSDVDGSVAKAYGVLKEGAKKPSAQRVTFVIDENGVIRKIIKGVKAEEHPTLALEAVKSM